MFCFQRFLLVLTCCFLITVLPGFAQEAVQTLADEPAAEALPLVKVVVIDPGHGGKDAGIILEDELAEKDYVLALARELKKILLRQKIEVFLTRNHDVPVTILERITLANRKQADVFISLHLTNRVAGKGYSPIIYINRKIIEKAFEPQHENISPGKGKAVSWDRAQNDHLQLSKRLGNILLEVWRDYSPEVKKQTAETVFYNAPLAVLAGIYAPAVLVELPAPSSGKDRNGEALKAEALKAVAENLARGILRFLAGR